MTVRIIGAGLAGSEAAWQLAKRGHQVELYEMRPEQMTKAHKTGQFAELVCSNSFRGADLSNAVGLLKAELRLLGSLIMEAAEYAAVPAGGALAVDRVVFSQYVDGKIRNHPNIKIILGEISTIPESSDNQPVIVATGPLTSKKLSQYIKELCGEESLSFFDAISPIIFAESLDLTKMFRQSRYDKGAGDDYLNIPLDKEQYLAFVEAINAGEKFGAHDEVESDSIENLRPFEGCMPIEEMASRGVDTLRHGPMKPVGLTDPNSDRRPYAVVQLRQDDKQGNLWSMVGFQTRLKHPEQKRIFAMLPGMEQAEYVRLGSVHRNTFINSPNVLNPTLLFRKRAGLFFAGQITGSEGYVESTAGGLVAGINASRLCSGLPPLVFPDDTAIGALLGYISDSTRKEFQPMNISFGLMPRYHAFQNDPSMRKVNKKDRRGMIAERALELVGEIASKI